MVENKYFEKLNFIENPFFSEPINDAEKNPKGFINREKNLKEIQVVLDDGKGFLILTGDVGIGKTSLLKRAKYCAKQRGMFIIECNVMENYGYISFFRRLFDKILLELDLYDKLEINEKEQIKRALMYQRKAEENTINFLDEMQEAENIKRKLEFLDNHLFSKFPCVIIGDDTDKLDNEKFKKFISYISNLPKSALFLTTSNYSQINKITMKIIQDNFDHYSILERIKTEKELKKYVNGRIKNYTKDNKIKLFFGDLIYSSLFNRTCGNLRESFRYLRKLVERLSNKIKGEEIYEEILDKNLNRVIKEIDKVALQTLENLDKEVLLILSKYNNQDIYKITKMYNEKFGTKYPSSKIRNILDNCAQIGLIHKTSKLGRGAKTTYMIPKVLVEILV